MSKQLDRKSISERLMSSQRDNYHNINSVMMGVTLAGGTIILLQIIMKMPGSWALIPYWVTSLFALLVSSITWGRGTLLANSRGNLWDTILPLLLGVFEFLLFAVLSPDNKITDGPYKWWFLAMLGIMICAERITNNRLEITNISEDFSPEVQDLGREMMGWIKEDRFGTRIAIGATTVILIAMYSGLILCDFWNAVIPLPFLAMLIYIMITAEKQRKRIEQVIFQDEQIVNTGESE